MNKRKIERKRIIVFSFEGKNNKTESNYFSHFKPSDDKYLLKPFSSGATDPINMIKSTKIKRKDFDYNAREDLTFIFIDGDCDKAKIDLVKKLQLKQNNDIRIVLTNPCFELWFLNHFILSSRSYKNNSELIEYLCKYLPNYSKNKDYFDVLKDKTGAAVSNSETQFKNKDCESQTTVYKLINQIIIFKN